MSEITFTEQYRNADRSRWITGGVWDNEPDKVVWVDEATGLDAMALRNGSGNWCGYVGLPESHPWYGKGYGECLEQCDEDWCYEHTPEGRINVHGGLTFSAACNDNAPDHTQAICHLADDGRKVWWFGFDTSHAGDKSLYDYRNDWHGDTYRDLPYVTTEVQNLAGQLAGVAS